jgi:hypothetical protein
MKCFLFLLCSVCCAVSATAQAITGITVKVAVFAPVYLDSAFTNDAYKLGRNSLPGYMVPGLDFYNGVMMAVDSLNKEKAPVELLFYDSKTATESLAEIAASNELQDVSLIIASFTSRNEMKPLADLALEKKIPLVSATYPNDGGITGNPYFIMLNPTLNTHIEGVYKYVHRIYPLESILLFRKKGNAEDMIQSVLVNMNKRTPGIPLKMRTVELPDSFTAKQVTEQLDSTRNNIVICGSLDEDFGTNLSKALSGSPGYRAIAVGMPTWDGLRDISNNLEIVYSTPYNLTRTDKLSIALTDKYRSKFAGRPSDMVFKGFESMYHFTKLLLKYGNTLMDHLSEKEYKLFNDFAIEPVKTKAGDLPDYLENKKLYFIRKLDGRIKSVN